MLPLLLALTAAADRPNVVFIFTDDHAAHAISAYGSKINKTPHIDRLAREGMLFRNTFCTNSICGPSRAVILTGKHSHLNGFLDNHSRTVFDGSQPHVGKLMRAAGYQTAIVGKWHLKSDPTGFDRWAVLSGGGGQGTYYNPQFSTDKGPLTVTGYCTDVTTDLALDFLNKRDAEKPFFLMYQHKAPHRSWEPGPGQLGLYRDRDIPEPATLFDDHAGLAGPAHKQEMTVEHHLTPFDLKLTPPRNLNEEQLAKFQAAYKAENEAFAKAKLTGKDLVRWKYQRYIKDYLRCVAGVDENIGRVLKYLDDQGLSKNTIVVYSSDQGFYLGDRGWYDKRWMYEESLRMPFIVRWPGVVKPGSENEDLVQNLDFAPTFLDAAGAAVPADMQGHSLKPLLEGKTPDGWRKSIYYQYFEFPGPHSVAKHYGVRTATQKLIHYHDSGEWELFDLVADPGERKSVYADPKYQDDVKKLKAELDRLRVLYKADTFKEPTPTPPAKKAAGKARKGLALRLGSADDIEKAGGKLVNVKAGKDGLELDGTGHVALGARLDPSGTPLAVGAHVWPDGDKGVIVAHGGGSHGYSLYLEKGRPVFAVRVEGHLTAVKGDRELPRGRWTHVVGEIDAAGKLHLRIGGKALADAPQAGHVTSRPADGLSVGKDTGSHVGEYEDDNPFTGKLRDVRLYWGVPGGKEVVSWVGS
ncbi:MAG: sulfatase/phosphatase domain-containing protein [Gemmataceae bacterium]